MLTKKIEDISGGLFDTMTLAQEKNLAPLADSNAANSDDFKRGRMQARRLRRQHRLSRANASRIGGWAIRAW